MKRYIFIAFAFLFGGLNTAWACDLGLATTKDKAFDLKARVASAACNAGKDADAKGIFTGDAVAAKIQAVPHDKDEPAELEITNIALKREDGLAAVNPPSLRKLGKGTFFANLEFAAPGTWIVSLTLARGKKGEVLILKVPVRLNEQQAAAAVAKPSKVPSFTLQDLNGKTVTLADLKGKVWIANFFFASCPEVCPLMARHLAELQRTFKEHKDFRIVSVSTDPQNDSPAVLKSFAKRNGATAGRWLFLKGSKAAVAALSRDGLDLDVRSESTMHSLRFALVDREGNVRARYDSAKLEEREQLKIAIKDLL